MNSSWLTWLTRPEAFILYVLAAWFVLYKLAKVLKLKEKGLDVKPLIFIYRTARFNRFLDDLSKRFREQWRVYSTLSMFLAFGLLLFSTYVLSRNLVELFMRSEEAIGLMPILPGITIGLEPLLHLLPAILLGLTLHEMAHGVVARLENIPIKSSGILVAFLFFGGFVEPEEEAFRKSRTLSKLKVLSSGPSANLVLAFISLLLLNVLFQQPQGLLVHSVSPKSPLYGLGLDSWSVVKEINGVKLGLTKPPVPFITPYRNPLKELMELNITNTLTIKTDTGVFNVALSNSTGGNLGVRFYIYPYSPSILGDLIPKPMTFTSYLLLMYMCNINVALAIFNMLPICPLDGYSFVNVLIWKIRSDTARKAILICLNVFSLSLLSSNIVLTILRWFRILG